MVRAIQLTVAGMAVLIATTGQLQAEVVLDFRIMEEGPISTIGDATFSLAGTGEMGDPSISDEAFGSGLWNSTDGPVNPTNTILRVDFAAPVKNVTFDYNPQGLQDGSPAQGWTAFDSGLDVLASGSFFDGSNFYDLTAFSEIGAIEWNNGGNDWYANLETLSYEPVYPTTIPEPSSLALLGLGACVAGIGGARSRRARSRRARSRRKM